MKMARSHIFVVLIIIIIFFGILSFSSETVYRTHSTKDLNPTGFKHVIVDAYGPVDPWGKSVGDINSDGLVDLIVGGNGSMALIWYENPSWKKHVIATNRRFSTDHEVIDINKDGQNDIVSLTKTALVWYKNPDWPEILIDSQ
jgi:hypothetical protein